MRAHAIAKPVCLVPRQIIYPLSSERKWHKITTRRNEEEKLKIAWTKKTRTKTDDTRNERARKEKSNAKRGRRTRKWDKMSETRKMQCGNFSTKLQFGTRWCIAWIIIFRRWLSFILMTQSHNCIAFASTQVQLVPLNGERLQAKRFMSFDVERFEFSSNGMIDECTTLRQMFSIFFFFLFRLFGERKTIRSAAWVKLSRCWCGRYFFQLIFCRHALKWNRQMDEATGHSRCCAETRFSSAVMQFKNYCFRAEVDCTRAQVQTKTKTK